MGKLQANAKKYNKHFQKMQVDIGSINTYQDY